MKSYRIYINNNTLFIADSIPKQIEKIQDFVFMVKVYN